MKKLVMLGILTLSTLNLFCSEPYDSIHVLPFDPHGWFINADPLGQIIDQNKPKTVIEMGSWLGCSTRFLAERCDKVYAIDTWCGSPEESVHMNNPNLPYLYQQFLSNTIHANLTDKIVPIRMNSLEAARALNLKADLIYIDGAHDIKSVIEDVLAWYPHLNENGIMCGDDWSWPSVREGVIHCSIKLNRKICAIENFWWFYE